MTESERGRLVSARVFGRGFGLAGGPLISPTRVSIIQCPDCHYRTVPVVGMDQQASAGPLFVMLLPEIVEEGAVAEGPRRVQMMSIPGESRPVRVCFDHEGEPVTHEVVTHAPCGEDIRPLVDLSEQMKRDGLSLPAVSTNLRRWALAQPDVEKLALSYANGRYALAVLVAGLSFERMLSLQIDLAFVRSRFESHSVIIYPLSEKHACSPMLTACDCRVVFDRPGQV